MTRWTNKRFVLAVLSTVVLALIVLAGLQFHWVAQVSAGELARMQAHLRIGAARVQEDFDRELARAYLSFQIGSDTVAERDWERYARRFRHWSTNASYPQIVEDVYLVEVNQLGRIRLSRWNSQSQRFAPVPWPQTLTGIRAGFERAYKIDDRSAGVSEEYIPDAVVEDVPALIVPSARRWTRSDREAFDVNADILFAERAYRRPLRACITCDSLASNETLFSYTIVTLNRHYMAQAMLPALARQHLGVDGHVAYNLAVVSQAEPQRVIYRSGTGGLDRGAGDASVSLFSVRFDELNRLLLTNTLPLDGAEAENRAARQITVGIFGSSPRSMLASGDDAVGRWQLTLTHEAGSLEAAVGALQRRNLVISLCTVLILAVVVALLVVSTQRAQRLAEQQIRFAASISHELRTPLAVIRSAGDNLAHGIVTDAGQTRRYGTLIQSESLRLGEMVEQALLFAGMQAQRNSFDRREVDIAAVVNDAVAAFSAPISEGGFVVKQSIQPDLPPVLGDAAALRRAVQNLIGNAIKYGGERRWIGISARVANGDNGAEGSTSLPNRPEVQITVRDHGLGIAPEDQPRIWEPFYRGRGISAAQIHGSGLGLSLVRHIVEAHHGQVHVDSALDRGSSFVIRLPPAQSGDTPGRQTTERTYEQAYTAGRG